VKPSPTCLTLLQVIGHPRHVKKALDAGVDLICAQAGEGGGHTGDIAASILVPTCVDIVKGHTSPLTGKPIYVIGAGAVFDGRSLAANLMWGAQGVWVGTRFVASEEAGAPAAHKQAVLTAGYDDIIRTIIYTGRPLRARRTPYIEDWCVFYTCTYWAHFYRVFLFFVRDGRESNRQAEIKELTAKGIIPNDHEMEKHPEKSLQARTFPMGNVAAVIKEILPAREIVDNMVSEAAAQLRRGGTLLDAQAKL